MSVGINHKGDFQSYMYAKGSTKFIELKIDAVALAADPSLFRKLIFFV